MKKLLSILGLSLLSLLSFGQASDISVNSDPVTGTVSINGNVDLMLSIGNIGNRDLNWTVSIEGPSTTFTKTDRDATTNESAQDRITDDVWITRGISQPLFNAAVENSYNGSTSPIGTLWSAGASQGQSLGNYDSNFRDANGGCGSCLPGNTYSMYLENEKRFFDITFNSWTSGGAGGGFSYTRNEYFAGFDGVTNIIGSTLPTQKSDILIPFDATGLVAGEHFGVIKIESDDPDSPTVFVDVIVTVTGGTPSLSASGTYDFGDYFLNNSTIQNINITNNGDGFLDITNITSDNSVFSPEETSFSIAPGQIYGMPVSFQPNALASFNGILTVESNDGGSPLNIALSGNGIGVPSISLNSTTFNETLASGNDSDQTLTITNDGASDLEYTITWSLGKSDMVTASKPNNADWTMLEYVDQVSPSVWFTRQDSRGLFNIFSQTFTNRRVAPTNTLWTAGLTSEVTNGNYNTTNRSPQSEYNGANGDPFSFKIISEERYFDLFYTDWSRNNGGAFTYNRQEIYHWLHMPGSSAPFSYTSTVTPGNSVDLTLNFRTDGLEDGRYFGVMNVKTNIPNENNVEVNLDLTVEDNFPEAIIYEASLNLGSVGVGGTITGVFNVINNGLEPLNITGIDSNSAFFSSEQSSFQVAPLSHKSVEINFSPLNIQNYAGIITVSTDDPNNPTLDLPVSGDGLEPSDISLNDNGLTGVTILTGNTDSRTLTITNNGNADLNWSLKTTLVGATEVNFTKEDNADVTLEENQDRIEDDIWLTRKTTRPLINIAQEGSYSFGSSPKGTLWSQGVTAGQNLGSYDDLRAANGGSMSSIPGQIYSMYLEDYGRFFDVTFNSWTSNGQGGGFSYTRIEVPGWLSPNITSGVIGSAASTNITLDYDPLSLNEGTYDASIILTSNDPDQPEIVIPIQMIIEGIPDLQLSSSNGNFGNGHLGFSSNEIITISNEGTATIVISDITSTDGAYTTDFTSATIVPGESKDLTITFTPTSIQSYPATLSIISNDAGSPANVTLSGNGLEPGEIEVNPTDIDIAILTGDTHMEVVSITNNGTGDLNWSFSNLPSWITSTANNGTAAMSTTDMPTLTFDLAGENQGVYEGVITVASDDPVTPEFNISMRVDYGGLVVTNPISDRKFNEGFKSKNIDFNTVFTDSDGDIPTYIIISLNKNVVTANNDANPTLLDIVEKGTGTSNITIRADDGNGNVAYDDFDFRVNDVPRATTSPVLKNVGFGTDRIDLNSAFVDSDTEDNLRFSNLSNTDPSIATVSLDGDELVVTEVAVGSTLISLSVSDGSGGFASDTFTFRINSVPQLTGTPLSDVIVDEGFSSQNIAIPTFTDADAGDIISYSVSSSDNSILEASINGNMILVEEVGLGSATITLRADDGFGGVIMDNLLFRVNDIPNAVNQADLVSNEGIGSEELNVKIMFIDSDQGDILSYSVSSSNLGVVGVSLNGSTLTITEVGTGTSTISITADDGVGAATTNEFSYRVNDIPNNDTSPSDIMSDEGIGEIQIDISNVFSDTDGGDVLEFSAKSSNAAVARVRVSGTSLTIIEVGNGNAIISISVEDGSGGSNSDSFSYVINDIPDLVGFISDINEKNGFGTREIDIEGLFTDSDGDAISYIASSDDESVVTASTTGNTLTITDIGLGTANITIIANDGITTAPPSYEFAFSVSCSSLPKPTISTAGEDNVSDEFVLTSSSEVGNQWFLDGVEILGATTQTLNLTAAGSYSVQVTIDGCQSPMSNMISVTSNQREISILKIVIWPNPVHNTLKLEGIGITEYQIYDLQGKMISDLFQVNSEIGSFNMDVTNLNTGTYLLKVSTQFGIKHQIKFIKE